MHEYGHYLQSRTLGLAYIGAIGIPSLISAQWNKHHNRFYTEIWANKEAHSFFKDIYGSDFYWEHYKHPLYYGDEKISCGKEPEQKRFNEIPQYVELPKQEIYNW